MPYGIAMPVPSRATRKGQQNRTFPELRTGKPLPDLQTRKPFLAGLRKRTAGRMAGERVGCPRIDRVPPLSRHKARPRQTAGARHRARRLYREEAPRLGHRSAGNGGGYSPQARQRLSGRGGRCRVLPQHVVGKRGDFFLQSCLILLRLRYQHGGCFSQLPPVLEPLPVRVHQHGHADT